MSTITASKGQTTRDAIIERAAELAMRHGLDGLTIGALASAMQMSKSGVFAHFGSREDLQLAVLEYASRHFADAVLVPAVRQRRGLPRLRAIFELTAKFYESLSNHGGCVLLSATMEFDDRPGPIRDAVLHYHRQLRRELIRAVSMARDSGELKDSCDPEQIGLVLFGLMLATHHDLRLLNDQQTLSRSLLTFEALLEGWRSTP